MVMTPHVFVYGTLRRDARPHGLTPLCRGWLFEGYGSVPGVLYDFGAYPGAVPSEASSRRVRGELYELPSPPHVLRLLDRYEGCGEEDEAPYEFEREVVDIAMEDGTVRKAWIYWYRGGVAGRELPSGDYMERMRTRPSA